MEIRIRYESDPDTSAVLDERYSADDHELQAAVRMVAEWGVRDGHGTGYAGGDVVRGEFVCRDGAAWFEVVVNDLPDKPEPADEDRGALVYYDHDLGEMAEDAAP